MEKEQPEFYYGIMRILDCGFIIEEAIDPNIENMKIGYAMNFLFSVPDNWIQYLIRVDFRDGKTGITFVSGTVQTTFSVRNLVDFVDENEKVAFPNGSLETLFGIAFGHLRAILAKNIGGTKFNNIYVPVIDANIVFHDLLNLNIQKFNESKIKGEVELLKKEDKIEMENIALAPNIKAKTPTKRAKRSEV